MSDVFTITYLVGFTIASTEPLAVRLDTTATTIAARFVVALVSACTASAFVHGATWLLGAALGAR